MNANIFHIQNLIDEKSPTVGFFSPSPFIMVIFFLWSRAKLNGPRDVITYTVRNELSQKTLIITEMDFPESPINKLQMMDCFSFEEHCWLRIKVSALLPREEMYSVKVYLFIHWRMYL